MTKTILPLFVVIVNEAEESQKKKEKKRIKNRSTSIEGWIINKC